MSDRKTLQLRDPSQTDPPALKKRGRGWEISDKRLDNLHDQARHMRRHSSAAHKVLAARFAKADLGRYKFTRHAVVGSAIVDFNCHNLGMAIAIDEVLARIPAVMRMRIGDRKDAARAHAQANPKQDYSRPNRAPHGKTNAQDR